MNIVLIKEAFDKMIKSLKKFKFADSIEHDQKKKKEIKLIKNYLQNQELKTEETVIGRI